ncbi:MAG: GNAT family N-acetyltransferase [Gammaproteobacteria bacterium]|nr:GNAT family N-acetyltransferase [Gammaproteobacteria bacterium]
MSLIASTNSVFADLAWQGVLEKAFRAKPLYFLDPDQQDGFVVQVFPKGPFRVGYIGFPIGGTVRGASIGPDRLERVRRASRYHKIHTLRLRASAFRSEEDLAIDAVQELETAVLDLQRYEPEAIAKVKRDINRARRFHVMVHERSDEDLAPLLYRLYASTISRHQGIVKYNLTYFSELIGLTRVDPRAQILIATVHGHVAGYLVLVMERDTAYYLHGAVEEDYKSYGVMDMLVYEAIGTSKRSGMQLFNMMISPANQVSLVRYKEKWGGTTRSHLSYEIGFSPFWNTMLQLATQCYGLVHRYFPRVL